MTESLQLRRGRFRLAIVFLAIFATLAITSVSVLPSHIHAKAPGTGCEVCVIANSVSHDVQIFVPLAPAPLLKARAYASGEPFVVYQSQPRSAGLTRGPPSFLSLRAAV